MGSARRWALVAAILVLVAGFVVWLVVRGRSVVPLPGCTVALANTGGTGSNGPTNFALSPEQAGNAATIAAVGFQLGMPNHAVTVALATAMQESKLTNLAGGDRDSAGLFQQRPSQGWGTYSQITDPVYASTVFYQHLRAVPGWQTMPVTEAAQAVQHSAAPDGYARWTQDATATAIALTGATGSAFTCHDIAIGPPTADIVSTATAELGTAMLSGRHDTQTGWLIATWLVAHCGRLGIDRVTFDGQTWTAQAGSWSRTGARDGMLSLHQVPRTAGTPR